MVMTFDPTLRVYGSGSPIVLIPGFAGNHRHWAYQISELKNSFKLICINNTLMDDCFAKASDFLIDNTVSYIYEMIRLLNIGHVHLLGHSMGAMIAIEYAKKYSHSISSLIISSLPIYKNLNYKTTPLKKLSYLLKHGDVRQFYKKLLPHMFSVEFKKTPQYHIIETLLDKNTEFYDYSATLCQINAVEEWKKKITENTRLAADLVIYGSEDNFSSVDMEFLKNVFPLAQIEIIENAGHAVHIEKAKEFNMIIHQFIKEKTQS
jgi:pimeloyl-ACP methyl ester carboxylesterase